MALGGGRLVRIAIAAVAVACLGSTVQVHALDIPAAPTLETPIIDQTRTLTDEQIQQLSADIAKSRTQKSYQIGVLIIPTLGTDEYLEGYALKVAREWGIGEKDQDNGVLLLVVKNDRKVRIEVGRGLEGDLTDVTSSRIIRYAITPKFKQGDYYGGISSGIESIQHAVAKEADPALTSAQTDEFSVGDAIMFGLVAVPMALIWLGAILGRTKSWWAGGVVGGAGGVVLVVLFGAALWTIITLIVLVPLGLLFDFAVSRNYRQHISDGSAPSWWAGGTHIGGGGFGGSGGGFGGGGFGGGGASGSW